MGLISQQGHKIVQPWVPKTPLYWAPPIGLLSLYTSMMIIIVGASLSEQHTDLHTAGFATRMHK